MYKLLRFYNQNRLFVIWTIVIIALIILIIQVTNSFLKEKSQNITGDANSSTNTNSTTISQGSKSVITGEEVRNGVSSKDTIKEFVKYCNEGKVEDAYNMLTDDCKERIYPTLERFKSSYVDKIFTKKRMYNLENWYTTSTFNTYSIEYTEDVLATGNVKSSENYSDYITVQRLSSGNKININSYIGVINENRTKTVSGITVTVDKMHMYMDYTILSISVKNNTENTICIDTKENVKTMYLYDENKVKYTALLNENSSEELQVRRRGKTTLNVKFAKMYNPESREIYGIRLEDIVLNYEKYINKKESKNKVSLDIGI